MAEKTHREVKSPTVSARFLADYMASGERARRSIITSCKFHTLARVFQHDEARLAVGKFIRGGLNDVAALHKAAEGLRTRLHDTDFERSQMDVNADFILRFASVATAITLPEAAIEGPGHAAGFMLGGVKVNPQILFRLRRITRTNKTRVGAGALRYAKGKPLSTEVGSYQSAFLFGYLRATSSESEEEAEQKLCITVDAFAGKVHPAPTDSTRKFQEMEAACTSIAERWANIPPPANAVL